MNLIQQSIDKNEDNQMKHSKISHPTRKTFGDNFRTSLHNVSSFYEANNKILSSRFAGIDENEEEIFEENKDDMYIYNNQREKRSRFIEFDVAIEKRV